MIDRQVVVVFYWMADPIQSLHFQYEYTWPLGSTEPKTGPTDGGTTITLTLIYQLPVILDLNQASHNYIGHNYTGHDYIDHDYIDHNYIGHN